MNLTLPPTLPSNLQSIPVIDLRPKLPVNPKYTWKSLKGERPLSDLSVIVFHHDALAKSQMVKYSDEQLAGNIARSHINSTKNIAGGDPGFPYHAWIRNGKIYICNDIEDFTYGVAANNGYTVHICVSGNYAGVDELNYLDRNALYAAYYLFKSNMPKFVELKAHKELTPTECPGYDMAKVRSDLESIELVMAMSGTKNEQINMAVAVRTRIEDLYGKAIEDKGKWQSAALSKFGKISEFMKAEGLL